MDSAAKILASGSTSEEDIANSSDEDEHLIIVDVVGDCEDDVRTKERSTEVVPNRSAPTDEDAKYSDSQSHASMDSRGGATDTLPTGQRRMISERQRSVLWETFQRDSYPNGDAHKVLAAQLNMDEKSIKSWFENHRTQLRRTGSQQEPVAKLTSRIESQATASTPKREPAVTPTSREHSPLAENEAPAVPTGNTSRLTESYAATFNNTYKPMTQMSLSPNHPFYFLTDSRMDACSKTVTSLKRKTPPTKVPSAKSDRPGPGQRPASEPSSRRRRMTPRQRREHRKLALQLVAQSTVVTNPDQPLDLSTKSSCDRLTPPAKNSCTEAYSSERRSAFLPMARRNSSDPYYYPMAMGMVPYAGVNYPNFPSFLGHQWPVHAGIKK